jgi:SAM-dependent methyltransferase
MILRDRVARAIAALPPGARFRVRNYIGLGRWLRFSLSGPQEAADEYPDTFWQEQQTGDWRGLAALIRQHVAPRSVVDIGCGDGRLLAAIHALDPALPVLGIDSSAAALARAQRAGLPVERHDLSFWRPGDTRRLKALTAGFDVALSLETAEHLPPWGGRRLVTLLTQGRIAVFSAAHPGQGGTWHINERPFEYWHALFRARGFHLGAHHDVFRHSLQQLRLPWWYGINLHLFERAPR